MAIDIIGVLYGSPLLEDGPSVGLDGWHVNVTRGLLAVRPDLEPFVVTPSVMRRVWAGDDPANPTQTVALRFADEVEALANLPAD